MSLDAAAGQRPADHAVSRAAASLRRNFEAMDPLEWLARMSDHIPDPGQHRTPLRRVLESRERRSGSPEADTVTPLPSRRRAGGSSGWARLIAKVYQVDPLVCTRCGQRMSILAFVTDQHSIRTILGHLGLPPAAAEQAPARARGPSRRRSRRQPSNWFPAALVPRGPRSPRKELPMNLRSSGRRRPTIAPSSTSLAAGQQASAQWTGSAGGTAAPARTRVARWRPSSGWTDSIFDGARTATSRRSAPSPPRRRGPAIGRGAPARRTGPR